MARERLKLEDAHVDTVDGVAALDANHSHRARVAADGVVLHGVAARGVLEDGGVSVSVLILVRDHFVVATLDEGGARGDIVDMHRRVHFLDVGMDTEDAKRGMDGER